MHYVRTASVGILSGLIAGVAWGIGARLAMRLIAMADGHTPSFSVGGTLIILMVGAFFGIPLGLILIGLRRFIRTSGWQRGLIFGAIVMLALAYPFYIGPLQAEGSDRVLAIAATLFGTLFIVFGLTLELSATGLERLMARARPTRAASFGIATLVIGGSFEVYMLLAMMANSSS